MANNVRRLRVAFLLTPSQLARRIRAEPEDVHRIESPGYELGEEWIRAVASGLGVPAKAVTDPLIDVDFVKANAAPPKASLDICPIATKHAIIAVISKMAGSRAAAQIDDDDLARAIQNYFAFVDNEPDAMEERLLTRQTLALRIAVLAILQSLEFQPDPRFESKLDIALAGASDLIRQFSSIDP